MISVFGLLQHIWLGFVHVLALLFLPSYRSFQTVHELTDAGYRASYLDHCRTQHNVRFGTLAYSLVLASSIALVTTTVQILYPEEFNQPVYAATRVVNSNGDDDDGACDGGGAGDCTLREALAVASAGDIVNFTGDMTITVGSKLVVNDSSVTIDTGTFSIGLDCANNPAANTAVEMVADNGKIQGLNVDNCAVGVNVIGDNNSIVGGDYKENQNSIVFNTSAGSMVDDVDIDGIGTENYSAIALLGAINPTISRSTIHDHGTGINVSGGTGADITDNSFYDISDTAIGVQNNATTATIDGNKFGVDGVPLNLGTTTGVSLRSDSSDTIVTDNTFEAISANSVQVDGANQVVSNNLMEYDVSSAIAIQAGSGHRIFGNTITNTKDYAIRITDGSATGIGFNADGSGSANTITDSVGGISISNADTIRIDGNDISVSGVNAALTTSDADETVFINNIVNADQFASLTRSDRANISDNILTDDDATTTGTNVVLDSTINSIISGNTITVSDADVMIIQNDSNTNTISDNIIDGLSKNVAGFEVTNSIDNTFTGNTISNIPGNAFALTGSTAGTVIGNSLSTEDSGNTFFNNTTDVSVDGGVTQTLVRGNSTDNADTGVMLKYNGTVPINAPIITLHSDIKLEGTASLNGVVDIYGRDDAATNISFITGVRVNTDGTWSSTDPDLANNSDVYLTVSTADAGTSPFVSAEQPQTAIEISGVTATVLSKSSATIRWTTNVASTSKVDYGTAENNLSDAEQDDTAVTKHEVTLTDLEANTTYYYKVVSADADYTVHFSESAIKSFTTESGSFGSTLPEYAEKVSQTVVVNTIGESTTIVGNATTTAQLPYGDLTFVFTDNKTRLSDYRLHFVLRIAKKQADDIINKKKAFNEAGKARFTVKKQQLALEKTYAVYSGVIKDDHTYLNNDGLAKRFTFTLLDVPQLIYPSTDVFYRMPEEFIVASKAPSVIVYLDDVSGNEVMHCTAVMTDGIGSCQPPFHVPGLGEYTVRLVDARGGSLSRSVLVSDISPNNTITTDTRSANFYKRIVFNGQPTFAGLVGTGDTIELHIPQINGPMLATVTDNSWVFKLKLTTLPFGSTTVTVIERNSAGDVVSQTDYLVYRSYRPVIPAVISPANNSTDTTVPTLQVVGPNDHTLEVFNNAGVRLFIAEYVNGGRTINLAEWFSDPGTHTVTLQNRNRLNIPSKSINFTFTISAPITVVEETTTNTHTSTDTDTSTTTDTTTSDTDGDSVSDGDEIVDRKLIDTDKDGLADIEEPDYGTDPNDSDTDDDTMYDGDEVTFGSDPLTADGDEDGLTDPQEYTLEADPRVADTDNDQVLDGAELTAQTSPTDFDSDDDGLSDNEQRDYDTDPTDADSDDDGLLDGEEIDRGCDPLNKDSDDDAVDDLAEALAGTDCSSTDNIWSNLTGIETYVQELARAVYEQTGTESFDYPLLTHQLVEAEADLDQTLTNQITTATTLDIIPGAHTVVSAGAVRVITKTTEISLVDWLRRVEPTSTDTTYVLVSGTIALPDSVKTQPTYVFVTFFSAPVVKIAQVKSNGQWTMTVPAELLTAGGHTAFAALEVNGTRSEQVEVAKFVINHKRKLSNTSWLIIVNVVVAVVALLIAIVIHLRRKRADVNYA